MKTILVTTDFSASANNAVKYATQLATALHANIKIMHAIKVPSENVMAAQVAWPLEDYGSLTAEANDRLAILAETMSAKSEFNDKAVFKPVIDYTSQVGNVVDITRNLVQEENIGMVVMGMSGAGSLSRFFLGSNSRDMIENASFPLLLIPSNVSYAPVNKIAFATELNPEDLKLLQVLAQFVKPLNAEILITHITKDRYENHAQIKDADKFLNEISSKLNYHKIYYRHLNGFDVNNGLTWLCEHGQVDVVAMVHRQRSVIERLFDNSHTQDMARHINVPLMVFNH